MARGRAAARSCGGSRPRCPDSPAEALGEALRIAKGRLVLVTAGTGSELLEHRAALEQLVRAFGANPELQAIALADAGPAGRYPLRLLGEGEAPGAAPHAVAYRAEIALPAELDLDEADPAGSILRALSWRPGTQWRHAPGPAAPARARAPAQRCASAAPSRAARASGSSAPSRASAARPCRR